MNNLNKEKRLNKFKSMSSQERKALILKKMKANGIEVGSGVPNRKYSQVEVRDLIRITNCFPELRDKNQKKN